MTARIRTPAGLVNAQTPVILSASRATDIPAFYGDWFMNRLAAGWCVRVNPFNQKPVFIAFRDVKVVVFWTKNPAPFMKHLDALDARALHYYFQYTLNDYEREGFEPNLPALEKRIETFKTLSRRLGPDRVVWRFDPMMLGGGITPREILMRVWRIGEALFGLTSRLVVSFADIATYQKVQRNLVAQTTCFTRENVLSAEPDAAARAEICLGLQKMREHWRSKGWNLTIAACAEAADLGAYGIEHNACVSADLLRKCFSDDAALMHWLDTGRLEEPAAGEATEPSLFASADVIPVMELRRRQSKIKISKAPNLKDKGQREACGCIVSKDIGMYDTCPHFCVYCYANAGRERVIENRRRHDPASPFLTGAPISHC